MDADIVVIGSGFWGTAITLRLRQSGFHVLALDSGGDSASRAAGGLVRPTWLRQPMFLDRLAPDWWTPLHHDACLDFLMGFNLRACGEMLYHRGRAEADRREGLCQVDRPGLEGVERARVYRLEARAGGWTICTLDKTYRSEWVVVAAGFSSDALLEASRLAPLGIKPLPGRALLFQGTLPLPLPLTLAYRLKGDSRTRKATAIPWEGGLLRVGDTLEPPGQTRLEEQVEALEELAQRAGAGSSVGMMAGIRPVLPRLVGEIHGPRLVVASGGQRSGLATAGGVGLRVAQLIRGH